MALWVRVSQADGVGGVAVNTCRGMCKGAPSEVNNPGERSGSPSEVGRSGTENGASPGIAALTDVELVTGESAAVVSGDVSGCRVGWQ